MFIFAHIFAGTVFGLGLRHLTNDRRVIPVCIIGSILPDLIDKPLGLLFPSVLGSGRTIFHSLGIVCIILIIALLVIRSRLPAIGIASMIFFHQVFDEMWSMPSNWFYPFMGPFQGLAIPDYIGTYFWYEITNPGEWLFMFGTIMILATSYMETVKIRLQLRSERRETHAYMVIPLAFGCMGLYLVAVGFFNPAGTFIFPFYNQVTNVMAGLIALSGAIIWYKNNSY